MLSESAKKLLVALSDGGVGRGSTVNCCLQALGLYIFARGLGALINRGAYIRGTEQKKRFETSYNSADQKTFCERLNPGVIS